jgi:hypothetical protein
MKQAIALRFGYVLTAIEPRPRKATTPIRRKDGERARNLRTLNTGRFPPRHILAITFL